MGWRNWLEEQVEVVLTVLNQAAEAAYSVQACEWSGGKGRPRERDTVQLVNALDLSIYRAVDTLVQCCSLVKIANECAKYQEVKAR